MADSIKTELKDRLLTITLNRPEKRNAINEEILLGLSEIFDTANTDANIHVLLMTGAGEAFCAGSDAASADDVDKRVSRNNTMPPVVTFLRALSKIDKPFIGAVNGPAVGLGATMLLHCDLVYAAEHASLAYPFADLALIPEAASTQLLPAIVGHHRAADIFYFGKALDADTALALGLVNEVFPRDMLMVAATERALRLTEQPLLALRHIKRLLKRPAEPIRDRMKAEAVALLELFVSPERKDLLARLREKRTNDHNKSG